MPCTVDNRPTTDQLYNNVPRYKLQTENNISRAAPVQTINNVPPRGTVGENVNSCPVQCSGLTSLFLNLNFFYIFFLWTIYIKEYIKNMILI
jgi:hypothetical protein